MDGKDGFTEFVATRTTRLIRTARLLTGDWSAAEDLVQEALAKAWFAWSRLHGDPEPYVRRTVVTTYISQSRLRWRREIPSGDLPDSPRTDQRDPEQRLALWQALRQLPPRQRAVIVLRYYEDLTDHQIAEVLRCGVGTVKSQAAKALAKLRVHDTVQDIAGGGRTHDALTR